MTSGAGAAPAVDGERVARVRIPVAPGDPVQLWGDDVIEVWIADG